MLMPFGGWFDQYYEAIFKPAVEDAGLSPKRADDLYRPGTIVNDIWSYTQSARILIADLTGRNPNVFYELGLAHALAKPVILVTESIDQVPFDLRALRILEYDKNDPSWGDRLRTRITKSIGEILISPLQAVLPTFLRVSHDAEEREVTEQEKLFLELRQEVDLLRRELRLQHAPLRFSTTREAERYIRNLQAHGEPISEIKAAMLNAGIPGWWIDDVLNRGHQGSLFDFLSEREERTADEGDNEPANPTAQPDG